MLSLHSGFPCPCGGVGALGQILLQRASWGSLCSLRAGVGALSPGPAGALPKVRFPELGAQFCGRAHLAAVHVEEQLSRPVHGRGSGQRAPRVSLAPGTLTWKVRPRRMQKVPIKIHKLCKRLPGELPEMLGRHLLPLGRSSLSGCQLDGAAGLLCTSPPTRPGCLSVNKQAHLFQLYQWFGNFSSVL